MLEITFEYFDGSDPDVITYCVAEGQDQRYAALLNGGYNGIVRRSDVDTLLEKLPLVYQDQSRGVKPKALDKGASVCFNEKSRGIGKAGPRGPMAKKRIPAASRKGLREFCFFGKGRKLSQKGGNTDETTLQRLAVPSLRVRLSGGGAPPRSPPQPPPPAPRPRCPRWRRRMKSAWCSTRSTPR